MCDRCIAESADYAAKAQAAYAANGWTRIVNAIRHEDELVAQIVDLLRRTSGLEDGIRELALLVIDAVRKFDEHTLAMRDAKDDHDQQNNEGQDHAY